MFEGLAARSVLATGQALAFPIALSALVLVYIVYRKVKPQRGGDDAAVQRQSSIWYGTTGRLARRNRIKMEAEQAAASRATA